MSSVLVDKLGAVGKSIEKDNVSLQQLINRIPLIKYRYIGSFPSDYVPTHDNDSFATKNKQQSKLQCEHWKVIANACQKKKIANILGRKRYTFLKQRCEQMVPEPLPSHPSVCVFCTIYAALNLFKFRQGEIKGVQDGNLLSIVKKFI